VLDKQSIKACCCSC